MARNFQYPGSPIQLSQSTLLPHLCCNVYTIVVLELLSATKLLTQIYAFRKMQKHTSPKSLAKHARTVCFLEPELPDKVMMGGMIFSLRKYSVR